MTRVAFCERLLPKEFEAHGLQATTVQANVAQNIRKGTLRGMHFQFPRPLNQACALHARSDPRSLSIYVRKARLTYSISRLS